MRNLKKSEVSFPNLWDNSSDETIQTIMDYADDYKAYMDLGKTERHFINLTIETLENMGFVPLESQSHFEPGSKVYQTIRSKGLVAAVVGTDSPDTGFNLIGAHVDAPRLDLKRFRLWDNELVYLKTHYYGGIKKISVAAVHWRSMGRHSSRWNAIISDRRISRDPVLDNNRFAAFIWKDQMNKKATEVITGEDLNVLIASRPYPDAKVSGRFKLALLKLLNERYELTERDLVTAEIEIVPAGQARDVGLDKSMIGAYAQDDRVCAYTALTALTHVEKPKRTIACLLFDKEEIGSQGNTGAQSRAYEYALQELYVRTASTDRSQLDFARMLLRCQMLSADVSWI